MRRSSFISIYVFEWGPLFSGKRSNWPTTKIIWVLAAQKPTFYIVLLFVETIVVSLSRGIVAIVYVRGATGREPATNGYPPNYGGRTQTRPRVTRRFRGPEPGPTGTRTTHGPVYRQQAGLTSR